MTSLLLHTLDPSELMPAPDIPESFGPRNDDERRVYTLVKEALESGPGKNFATVADFMAEIRKSRPTKTP